MTNALTFSNLPKDVLTHMYDSYFIVENDQKGITSISLINKYSCEIVQQLFRNRWDELQTWRPSNSKLLVNLMRSVDLTGLMYNAIPRSLFILLKYKFFENGVYEVGFLSNKVPLTTAHFLTKRSVRQVLRTVQSKNDLALITVWPKINEALPEECKKNADELNSAFDIRNYIDELAKKGKLASIKELDFSSLNLADIPIEIEMFSELEILNLNDNHIQHIPDLKMPNLLELNLGKNFIKTIPNSISDHLTCLNKLKLESNHIKIFPDAILRLACLEILDLGDNKIQIIPNSISDLTRLKSLDFSFNKIEIIPDSISNLTCLDRLCILGNKIEIIPDSILSINKEGFEASFECNLITKIPNKPLTVIKKIRIYGNQLLFFVIRGSKNDNREITDLNFIYNKHLQFNQYKCESDFSNLCKLMIFESSNYEKIKEAFCKLNDKDKKLIKSFFNANIIITIDENGFDGVNAFYLAVCRAIRKKFENLSPQDQEAVRKVVDLRQGYNADLDIFDNILLLLDVINEVEKGANKICPIQ
jgi:Leucine-rich repeat (LRR) protein